jgi:Ca2+-binding EF-hand superfamily protein
MKLRLPILLVACCALSACASHHHRQIPENERPKEWHPSRDLLTKYDANHDGTLTKAEMEAGLKAEFAAADVDRDGCLKADEVRTINEKRIQELGSTATPLIDWNQDGCVDFNEFAGPVRSLFTAMDRDEDGKLDPKELNPRAAAQGKKGQGQGEGSGRHRHHRGGGNEGGDQAPPDDGSNPDGAANPNPDGS